jgi:hypothetical protein
MGTTWEPYPTNGRTNDGSSEEGVVLSRLSDKSRCVRHRSHHWSHHGSHHCQVSEGRDVATKGGGVKLYDSFLDVVKQLKGTSHQSPQEWFDEICEKAREHARLQ